MEHIEPAMMTTAFELPGFRITKNIGMSRGVIVRSRSIFGTIGGGLQTLVGGDISLFSSLCERARDDAFKRMAAHAAEMGGNAVVGVRYDAASIGSATTEVLAYGTAVVVERA